MAYLCFFLALAFATVAAADAAPPASPAEVFGTLQKVVDYMKTRAKNKTAIDAQVQKFLHQADAGAKETDILHMVQATQHAQKKALRALRSDAKKGARLVKSAARQVEQAAKRSGVPEKMYEKAYQVAEHQSEKMEDKVEDLADQGEDHVEAFFESVEEGIEKAIQKAQEKAEKKQEAQEEADEKAQEKAEEKQEKAEEKQEAQQKEPEKKKKDSATPAPSPSPPPAPPPAPSPPSPKGDDSTGAGAGKTQTLVALPAWSTHAFTWLACVAGAFATVVAVRVHLRRPQPAINSYPMLG